MADQERDRRERDRRVGQQTAICTTFLVFVGMAVVLGAVLTGMAADRGAHLAALRAALLDEAPASPSPSLAGRVVYARGTASTDQRTVDEDNGVTIPRTLMTWRRVEEWLSGRNSGWYNHEHSASYTSTDARLGGWELDPDVLLAADHHRVLERLVAGRDYPVPKGWALRGAAEAEHVYRLEDAADRNDDPDDHRSGDLRLSYRILPVGPLSVVALVDPGGTRLVPFPADGTGLALVGIGSVPPEAMFDAETAVVDEDRRFAIGFGLLTAWLGFAVPLVWIRLVHWAVAVTALAMASSALTVGATVAAASGGSILVGLLAGTTLAGAAGYLMVKRARRLGLFG